MTDFVGLSVEVGEFGTFLDEFEDFGLLRRALDEILQFRIFGGDGHVGAAVDGVDAGGVAGDVVDVIPHSIFARNNLKIDFGALRAVV